MPGAEEVAEDAPGELGGGGFALGGGVEEPQGGQGLPVDLLGCEDRGQIADQRLDLGRPSLVQQQGRLFEQGQGHVA